MADPLEALAEECEEVSKIVLDLLADDFDRPTRCTAWNVKELLGHMYRDVDRTNTALASLPPPEATHDAVTYWTSYDPVTDGRDIADRAKELAGQFGSGTQLAESWDEMWRRAVRAAGKADRTLREDAASHCGGTPADAVLVVVPAGARADIDRAVAVHVDAGHLDGDLQNVERGHALLDVAALGTVRPAAP